MRFTDYSGCVGVISSETFYALAPMRFRATNIVASCNHFRTIAFKTIASMTILSKAL